MKTLNNTVRRLALWVSAGLALAAASRTPAYDIIKDESNVYVVTLDPGMFPLRVMLPASPALSDGTSQSSSFVEAVNAWNALLGTVQLQATVLSPGTYATGNEINEIVMDDKIVVKEPNGQFTTTAFDENTLAVTMSYHVGNSRVESDIIFNTAYTWDSFRGGRLATNTSAHDIRRVAIHELGHVLGLDHPDQASPPQSVNAIMNSRVSYSPAVDTMRSDDIAGAQSLYGAPGFVPSNNNFASAITIGLSSGSTQVTGTNIAATTEPGEPLHAGEAGTRSVWWQWTAPAGGPVSMSTLGSNFDTVLGVYTGNSVGALTGIGSNDDEEAPVQGVDNPFRKRTSLVTFTAVAGTTYRIAVGGWDGYVGSITLNLNFTPAYVGNPPVIVASPVSATVNAGDAVNFAVAATGDTPLSYQWRRNGSPLSAANAATFSIASAIPSDAGDYDVVVTNPYGSATSAVAALTVIPGPQITRLSPTHTVLDPGAQLSLSVSATGTGALSYQWLHNGQPLIGQVGSTLVVPGVSIRQSGQYVAIVTDANRSRRSLPMRVTVAPVLTRVVVWGFNNWVNYVPASLTDVVALSAKRDFAVALKRDKTLVSWGQLSGPANVTGVDQVAAGASYGLALKDNGTVISWGFSSNYPHLVPSGLNSVVEVAAGYEHALALRGDGSVVAWGSNHYGQTNVPAGLTDVFAISAGGVHSLAIRYDGTVVTWGDLQGNELQVPAGLSGVVAVAAGYEHSLALKRDGTVVAWGRAGFGATTVPAGLTDVVAIAAGYYHSVALRGDGTVVAWGISGGGHSVPPVGLGAGFAIADSDSFILASLDGASAVVGVTGGYQASRFIRADGTLWAMGSNASGELGDGTAVGKLSPVRTLDNVVSTVQGFDHGFFVRSDGTLWGSGFNSQGALGVGDTLTRINPVQVASGVSFAVGGYRHSVFRKVDGTLWAMGWNAFGQLGDGTMTDRLSPVQVAQGVAAMAAGYDQTMFLKFDGTVWAMGGNSNGLFGDGSPTGSSVPRQIGSNTAAVASFYHSLFLRTDGSVWSAGRNDRGQLGDGTTVARSNSVQVATGVSAVSVGAFHSLLLKTDGTLWAMGANDRGQLGDGSTIDRHSPVQVATAVTNISAGIFQSHFIKADGSIWAMGANESGQLGDGTVVDRRTPVMIADGYQLAPANTPEFTSVSNSPTADQLKLQWAWPVGATFFEIWRNSVNNSATATKIAIVAGNYFEDHTALPGVSYYYWLRAGNAGATAGFNTSAIGRYSQPVVALRITVQPQSQTANVGGTITFSVGVEGTAPITYQWRKNRVSIQAAINASYTINDVSAADADDYDVVVTDLSGSLTSSVATLTVNKLAQTITFAAPADRAFSATPLTLSATASSGLPVNFTFVNGPATLAGNTLTLTGPGTVIVRAEQAGDDTYAAAPSVERSFAVSANLASWQSTRFTSAELLDPQISGPNADPDRDGLSNLLEYALGSEPRIATTAATTSGLPEVGASATDWTYTYTRPADRSDLTYAVEISTDLSAWTTANVTHELVSTDAATGTQTWRARVPLSTGTHVFFRLKVIH